MRIAFIHPNKSFLPEIEAYQHFFATANIQTIIATTGKEIDADIEWHFMGMDRAGKRNGVIKIHEYTSASIPPFERLKNYSKKILNMIPDYRLFLNNYVSEKLGFNDDVPFGIRDMGIESSFLHFESSSIKKEFDFVYAGSVSTERKIRKLIEQFVVKDLNEHSLLIISKEYDELKNNFRDSTNIHFIGPVDHSLIPQHIAKAKFAINFVPDEEPFNQQTSTKFLEYAALKIPVITTDYEWVRNFQKENGGSFFYLEKDLSNFKWQDIAAFNYSFPDLKCQTWEKQIKESGVIEFLQSKFPGLSF